MADKIIIITTEGRIYLDETKVREIYNTLCEPNNIDLMVLRYVNKMLEIGLDYSEVPNNDLLFQIESEIEAILPKEVEGNNGIKVNLRLFPEIKSLNYDEYFKLRSDAHWRSRPI